MAEPAPGAPPIPAVSSLDEHFWRGGASGQLLVLWCRSCGSWLHPPVPVCRHCLSTDLAPRPVSGRGHIKTYTVNHQTWFPALPAPYVVAIVELVEQEGLQFLTRLVDCPVDDVSIGMPVRVRFEPHGDVHLPLFAPDHRSDEPEAPA